MAFELYSRVKIKKNGIIGDIVDIAEGKEGIVYTVESIVKGKHTDADYPTAFPLYECKENDIEMI
jgi:hypothetical protein